ncbi:hypothetical protein [Rhodococcus sp. NPDC058521]|uniref:hypothetical protein n=1 Tax=Rhodococcus sp. NPDC058521 TaxID=3346536 RepID=UPI0036505D7C
MVEVGEVVVAASQLSDAEFLEVVRAVAAHRPGLAGVLAAADGRGEVPAPPVLDSQVVHPSETFAPHSADIPQPECTDAGVPTFDAVRDRIEQRAGTAAGAEELDNASAAGRSVEEQWAAREKAGKARLDEIRRSLGR